MADPLVSTNPPMVGGPGGTVNWDSTVNPNNPPVDGGVVAGAGKDKHDVEAGVGKDGAYNKDVEPGAGKDTTTYLYQYYNNNPAYPQGANPPPFPKSDLVYEDPEGKQAKVLFGGLNLTMVAIGSVVLVIFLFLVGRRRSKA